MGGGTWLDAEAVKGGLVAGGWREWVSCTVVAFGVCCWDGMVVGVDGWLLAGCWRVVVAVASVAISDRGDSGVSVVANRWQTTVTAHTSRYSVLNYLFNN